MNKERFEEICLAEFNALRDENLRCAQVISNTVWIGISGYVITIAAGIAAFEKVKRHDSIFQIVVILLCLQSLAASLMFLSETWKYIRTGIYIRNKIEKYFGAKPNKTNSPMYWEHWIMHNRTDLYYYFVLALLQLPIVGSFVLLLLIPNSLFKVSRLLHWGEYLRNDIIVYWIIISLFIIDVAIIIYYCWKRSCLERMAL